MNKKLKLYCSLFVVALIWVIVSQIKITHYSSSSVNDDIKQDGWSYGKMPESYITRDTVYSEGGGMSTSATWRTVKYTVNVKHVTGSKNYLLSTLNGNTTMVDLNTVDVILPHEGQNAYIVSVIIIGLLITIVVIWILCLVIKLIRSIRNGEIFVSKVARYLEIVGILLSSLYIFGEIVSCIWYHTTLKYIHLVDYYVMPEQDKDSLLILTGLGLMIISQIILMGKDLKDEQDLTI